MAESVTYSCPTCGVYSENYTFGQQLQNFLCIACATEVDSKTLYGILKDQFSSETHKVSVNKKEIPLALTAVFSSKYPQFRDFTTFDQLDGFDWAWILVKTPAVDQWCDFSLLSGQNWIDLLSKQPMFVSHIYWDEVIAEIKNKTILPEEFLRNSDYFFQKSLVCSDKHFVSTAPVKTSFFASEDDFWLLTGTMHWGKHVDWPLFSAQKLLRVFLDWPEFLHFCPFNTANIFNFQWESLSADNWKK